MHHPLVTVALVSVRHEDLLHEARQFQRHQIAAVGPRPDRAAATIRRLIRSIPRGIDAARALSRS
jgi:hypothetical protein